MATEEVKKSLTDLESRIDAQIKQIELRMTDGEKGLNKEHADLKSMVEDHAKMLPDLKSIKDRISDLEQKTTGANDGQEVESKSIGAQFVESEAFEQFKSGRSSKVRLEAKNTITNSGNTVSRHEQLPGVVPGAFRQLTVMPTVAMGSTSSNIIYFSRELAFTNNAAETAEGAAKPESVLTFEEVSIPTQTIPHFLRISKQAMNDSDFIMSYIDRRLRHGVEQRIESQIINGTGVGNLLSGWLATGNNVATAPAGTGNIFGLANKMKYEILSANRVPDFYYINPKNWAQVETTQRGTGDAAYVGASGALSYVNNGLTPLLWGLPVIVSNAVPENTLICKSQEADMYAQRESTTIEMSDSDGTNFTSNLVTVLAEARGAALNFVPSAIRTGNIAVITA